MGLVSFKRLINCVYHLKCPCLVIRPFCDNLLLCSCVCIYCPYSFVFDFLEIVCVTLGVCSWTVFLWHNFVQYFKYWCKPIKTVVKKYKHFPAFILIVTFNRNIIAQLLIHLKTRWTCLMTFNKMPYIFPIVFLPPVCLWLVPTRQSLV